MSKILRVHEFTQLPEIGQATPLADTDDLCMKELQAVLEKHGVVGRFGITLLHRHFELRDGEVLVETCDEKNRVLTTRPMELEKAVRGAKLIETSWSFDARSAVRVCRARCRFEPGPQAESDLADAICHN